MVIIADATENKSKDMVFATNIIIVLVIYFFRFITFLRKAVSDIRSRANIVCKVTNKQAESQIYLSFFERKYIRPQVKVTNKQA